LQVVAFSTMRYTGVLLTLHQNLSWNTSNACHRSLEPFCHSG